MAQREPSVLTTGQAAKLCDVTPDTVLKWIKKGQLRAARTAGGHYRVDLRDLQPYIPPGRRDNSSAEKPSCALQRLHCWEYLSDGGVVRDECKKCVVYRVRAAQCFQMADLGTEVGHARRFCQSSCEDCEYYRRVRGLPTNVLVITPDESLLERLSAEAEENESIVLRFARNAYEASAIIQQFQAAFVVVDEELLTPGNAGLLDSLAGDPRLPAVKIVLGVQHGTVGTQGHETDKDVVFSLIEKPFGPRRIAAAINGFPIEQPVPLDSSARL